MNKAVRDALIAQVQGDPLAQVRLARTLARGKYRAAAYRLANAATQAAPVDRAVARIARQVLSQCIGASFFDVVRNEVRNDAHDAAIRRAVRPGMRVLEIGTGAGVFAMMAARAGAEVVTCEMNTAMADTARAIIADNGLSGRISVLDTHSTRLTADAIGGRADLLISEVILLSLLDRRGREIMGHAVDELLTPAAALIPRRATACAARVPPMPERAWSHGDAHINSLVRIGENVLLLLHNGAKHTGRASEIAVLDHDWREIARWPLPGAGCHNPVVLENGDVLSCGSMVGELIGLDGPVATISDMMTPGLSVDSEQIVVGSARFSARSYRHVIPGQIEFLDRAYRARATLEIPGAPTEIRRLDGRDLGLSSFRATLPSALCGPAGQAW